MLRDELLRAAVALCQCLGYMAMAFSLAFAVAAGARMGWDAPPARPDRVAVIVHDPLPVTVEDPDA